MIEYSIVVPCFNEADNIRSLIDGFASFINADSGELIIVDNGSNDETATFRDELMGMYPFLKWIRIEKNIGYGHGIYRGLLQARGKILCYTHADLQTDPADVRKALDVIASVPSGGKVLVKGCRKERRFGKRFFSRGMEFIVRIILKQSFREINAQPNVFTREIFQDFKSPPLDWGFDLYLYYMAQKSGCDIRRFNVIFPDRRSGASKWNKGFFSKIIFSYRTIRYCTKLKHQ